MGETDLGRLLRGMTPVLHEAAYGIVLWHGAALPSDVFATVAEAEGLTVVAPLAALGGVGLTSDPWARITLGVTSDLAAVGLTATFATALAGVGISANVIAGLHHDHIFVQWDRRQDALATLTGLTHA